MLVCRCKSDCPFLYEAWSQYVRFYVLQVLHKTLLKRPRFNKCPCEE